MHNARLGISGLKFLDIISHGRKIAGRMVQDHKVELFLGLSFLILFTTIAAAAVVNSMYMQSQIGVA